MWRMVVIDDEPLARMGIRKMVDWKEYGVEICAEGEDGDDGLQKILAYRPQIILVDIRMPGMNGIELCKQVKELGIDTRIIIMSAYSEFEYAKQAITLGVENYLIKPIRRNELTEIIQKLLVELSEQKQELERSKKQRRAARQEMIRQLLMEERGVEYIEQMYIENVMEETVSLSAAIIFNLETTIKPEMELKDQITKFFLSTVGVDVLYLADEMIVVSRKLPRENYIHILEQLLHWLHKEKSKNYCITLGQEVSSWSNLNYSYESAIFLKDNIFLFGNEKITTLSVLPENLVTLPEDLQEKMQICVEMGELEELEEISYLCKKYFQQKCTRKMDIKIQTANTMISIQKSLEEKYRSYGLEFPKEQEIANEVSKCVQIEELRQVVMKYCRGLTEIIHSSCGEDMIQKVYQYIEVNYQKPITIDSVAKKFHYSNSYFGQRFKEETGKKFHTVLDEVRIRNAARLLRETNDRIYEIAQKVGISDPDRFALKFKSVMGVSANEYRRIQTKKE